MNLQKTWIIVMSLATILVAGCSSTPKTDEEQYRDIRGSAKYKAYETVSDEVVRSTVNLYNKSLDGDDNPVHEAHAHALLGLTWILLDKPVFTLADGKLALENSIDPSDDYIGNTLISLGLIDERLYRLGTDYKNHAQTLVNDHDLSTRYQRALVVTHLSGGLLALVEGDIDYSIESIKHLGDTTGQEKVIELATIASLLQSGEMSLAISTLEAYRDKYSELDPGARSLDGTIKNLKKDKKGADAEATVAVIKLALRTAIVADRLFTEVAKYMPAVFGKYLFPIMLKGGV